MLTTNLVAENNQPFVFGYDSTTQKYGHWVKEADTDVFVPFNGFIAFIGNSTNNYDKANQHITDNIIFNNGFDIVENYSIKVTRSGTYTVYVSVANRSTQNSTTVDVLVNGKIKRVLRRLFK